MNTKINKLLLTVGLSASTISANADGLLTFNTTGYNPLDYRIQNGLIPFPIIFHYNEGGGTSAMSFSVIDMNQPTLNNVPETLRNFINQNHYNNIQYFTAYCEPMQTVCNYFTHTWSMDKMIENRITSVSTGMFAANNLEPFVNEVGINEVGTDNLVEQNMSFHGEVYLSGNVARFVIVDPTRTADAWFISVYNPKDNDGNIAANQHQQVIVVHWYFIPTGSTDCTDGSFLLNFGSADNMIIAPQMTPVM